MLVTGSGQTPEVIDTDPGVRRIFSGIALPLAVRAGDREELFGVRPRPLAELAREAGSRPLCCMCSRSFDEPYACAATITCSAV